MYLNKLLKKEFPIEINFKHIKAIEDFKHNWEHKGVHWGALNTPLLGVTKIQFIDTDQDNFFHIFNINREDFRDIYQTSPSVFYIKYADEEDRVGKEQLAKVASDPFNGFIVYLTHLIANADISDNLKIQGIGNCYLILYYKFFTSVIQNSFKYPANESIMKYTIEHLSAMYTIRQDETSTWYLLLKSKAFEIYTPSSTYFNAIRKFDDDNQIVRIITNSQTKVRKYLINIIVEYYANYESDNRIISSSTVTNIDGEKLIQSINTSYQSIIRSVVSDSTNINKYIDMNLISLTVQLNKKLKIDLVKKMFVTFSTVAAEQYKAGKSDLIEVVDGYTLYVGYRSLLDAIIQKSFRMCIVDGVNMKSSKDILIKIKNAFTSSKIENKDIEEIKNSVSKFIEDNNVTSNYSLIPSLRISFIIYNILLSFKYL